MGSSESKQNEKNNGGGGQADDDASEKAMAVGAMVAAGLIFCGLTALLSGSGTTSNRKTMKAPGRDARIFRDVFENNPAAYFRDLRK
ncbi:hypothetical protein I3760_05G123900 [Carya illinoinensis]|uniref:Uncharacterized protein n=1 Tax=Carya illinoinensis TaxID=32201 RepID=A0A922JM34_CARIL|nr:hypothetical protein I3760_05G123900 [Carya illinoinensis]KAG6712793.1 hypothetical protein I3842_05G119600 [Carya illinoinensis]